MNARSALIKNETASSGIPRSCSTSIDLDLNTRAHLDFLVFAPAHVFGRIWYKLIIKQVSEHLSRLHASEPWSPCYFYLPLLSSRYGGGRAEVLFQKKKCRNNRAVALHRN